MPTEPTRHGLILELESRNITYASRGMSIGHPTRWIPRAVFDQAGDYNDFVHLRMNPRFVLRSRHLTKELTNPLYFFRDFFVVALS